MRVDDQFLIDEAMSAIKEQMFEELAESLYSIQQIPELNTDLTDIQ